jgi:hypothetical protein
LPGATVRPGSRPEHSLPAGKASASISGRVERPGGLTHVHALLDDGSMITVESREAGTAAIGEKASFGVDAGRTFLFGADGTRL